MIFDHRPAVIGHRGFGSGDVPLPVPPREGPREPLQEEALQAAAPAEPETTPETAPETVAENTLPSMLAAVEAGASWIEIDVTRTADDDLVLRHDPTTAGGDFLADIEAARTGLPRLADVFDALPAGLPVDVDVKTIIEDAIDAPSRRTGALLLPLLRREARRRPLLVTSFDPSLLTYLRENLPDVPTGLLTWLRFPLWHGIPAAAGLGLQAIGVHTGSCGFDRPDTRLRPLEHYVDAAHKADLEFIAWCPTAENAPDYAAAGVDAMVVNDVPGVVSALKSSKAL